MLYFALIFSDIRYAISYRKANALDATTKLVGGYSSILPKEQWKVEAQQVFETSIARIQIDARNVARGPQTDNTQDSIDIMCPSDGRMCNMYKFNNTGRGNVHVWGYLGGYFCWLGHNYCWNPNRERGTVD
jgi:hypothetical protein